MDNENIVSFAPDVKISVGFPMGRLRYENASVGGRKVPMGCILGRPDRHSGKQCSPSL
jgi:hypothetical protein